MKRIPLALLACVLLLGDARTGRADAAAEKLVEKAIVAHGGEKIGRIKTAVRTSTGVTKQGGDDVSFTDETILDLPERYRQEFTLGPQKTRVILVINGDKGWSAAGGAAMPTPPEKLKEMREELHVLYLATLVPLRREKRFELSGAPEATVEGKKAAGVTVKCKGHPDITLYFDKESGLLVKIAGKATIAGIPFDKEYLYYDHKEFDGIKLPTRTSESIAGRKLVDIKSVSYRLLDKADPKQFTEP